MKKSTPVDNAVDRILPASLVPTGRVLLNPHVLEAVRTSETFPRRKLTVERYDAEVLVDEPAALRMYSLPTMI